MKTGIAVVKFQLAAQTVTQIEKKLRYSSADYISNLGKYSYYTDISKGLHLIKCTIGLQFIINNKYYSFTPTCRRNTKSFDGNEFSKPF